MDFLACSLELSFEVNTIESSEATLKASETTAEVELETPEARVSGFVDENAEASSALLGILAKNLPIVSYFFLSLGYFLNRGFRTKI